jgi:hypothetical protein
MSTMALISAYNATNICLEGLPSVRITRNGRQAYQAYQAIGILGHQTSFQVEPGLV